MKNPLSDKRSDTWFYYYAKPIMYQGISIWKVKHKKTGTIQYYTRETKTYHETLNSAKAAIRAWAEKQQSRDRKRGYRKITGLKHKRK